MGKTWGRKKKSRDNGIEDVAQKRPRQIQHTKNEADLATISFVESFFPSLLSNIKEITLQRKKTEKEKIIC